MTDIVTTLHEELIAPTSEGNPRNGRGAIFPWNDGQLIFVYSRFTGGGADHSTADIWARLSEDDGYTWGESFQFRENIGARNTVSTGFVRLPSGDILFSFSVKHHESDACHSYVVRSSDGGLTWTSPVLITDEAGYFVINNDRFIQLSSGRLLLPVAKSLDERYHAFAATFYSDDEGVTWQRSTEYIDLPGEAGLQEPGVVERADGSLWMVIRTDKGYVYASESSDGGEHWSPPEPTNLVAPLSPATAQRLPGSDDILIIYNDRSGVPFNPGRNHKSEFNWRTPLSSAVSSDGGRTWHHHKTIETDLTKSYCYTSILCHKDTTLLTYYQGKAGGPNLLDIKLKIIPTAAWIA